MHELTLFKGLLNKIEAISRENEGKKIVKMKVKLGALAHISAPHFQEHFTLLSKGTAAEGAILEIEEDKDRNDPLAQEIILQNVEVEV